MVEEKTDGLAGCVSVVVVELAGYEMAAGSLHLILYEVAWKKYADLLLHKSWFVSVFFQPPQQLSSPAPRKSFSWALLLMLNQSGRVTVVAEDTVQVADQVVAEESVAEETVAEEAGLGDLGSPSLPQQLLLLSVIVVVLVLCCLGPGQRRF